ncbi:c-type cytochrome [Inhella proteolytica]|uniref:C-type cytochrome n=1 Tax=Inhella proteolytica TaxID=2795029 RepID=A0A931NFN2_9BURK|nr:c-type cytochrome [Inhella proteolytica]MBH9575808.1 c-type cytochrome [Inhella proteolytica]
MRQLLSALAIAFVALAALPAHAQDAAAGAKKIAMCIGCHGIPEYRASFPEVYRVPKISGQNAGYIVAALQAYAKGDRKHPTMRGIAGSLTEQDMKDIGAFYEQQGKGEPAPATVAAAPEAIAAKLQACTACHGANFSKTLDGNHPKLAGQHADFLYVALRSYQAEGKATWGRGNAIMQGQIKELKPAELKQIAAYLASLPGELKTVPQSATR